LFPTGLYPRGLFAPRLFPRPGVSVPSSSTSAFTETRLPEQLSLGAVGGPAFSTVVVSTASGAEERIALWTQGRRQWEIGYDGRSVAQASALVSFFIARAGRLRGFRFKDWSDYSSKVASVETKHTTAQLTTTTFQLQKLYVSGTVTYTRTITKPVTDTTKLFHPGTGAEITTGWTVDTTTGICTFTSAPGYIPTATFQFDVPVRFDDDQMRMRQDSTRVRSWSVPIVEVNI
jgi:uncharacterized protein (TIGR02217 family)